jgi:HlyD family secretion protein
MSIRFPVQYLPLTAIAIVALSIGGIAYVNLSQKSIQPAISETAPKLETVSALGRLEPDGEVIKVFAPISGESARIERLNVQHGQQIRKGEIIAYLDNYAPRAAALREAQERVAVAEAQLRQVEAGAKSGQIVAQQRVVDRIQVELQTETAAQEAAIARLEAELRNAELEDRRYQYLQKEGAVSSSLRDSKQLTSDTVRQQLNEAKAQLSRIARSRQSQVAESRATLDQIAEVRPVDVELARSQVAQAEAGVARAKADLDLAIVRSPQDGQVLKIHTRAGELVGNNGIISLGQTQRMVAVAEVYELDINRVKIGQSATVISKNNAFPETLRGKVKEVGLQISKKDVLNTDPAAQFDARVVEVKILLDEPSSRLVSGLTNLSIQAAIDIRE